MKKQKKIRMRHPRPMGTTEAMYLIHNQKQENKDKLIKALQHRLIRNYVTQDMKVNDEPWNINKLAKYLDIHPTIVMKVIQEEITRISRFMDGEENKGLARVIKFRALKLGLDVQGIGTQQAEVLMRAQGNKYVPFLSGAVNQAIGNLNGILKTQIELFRGFDDAAKPALGINEDKEFGNTGTQYLTTDMALKMITEAPNQISDEEYLNLKEKELGTLPDVCARNQDLSTIGIGLLKGTIIIPEVQPIPLNPASQINPNRLAHNARREHDGTFE